MGVNVGKLELRAWPMYVCVCGMSLEYMWSCEREERTTCKLSTYSIRNLLWFLCSSSWLLCSAFWFLVRSRIPSSIHLLAIRDNTFFLARPPRVSYFCVFCPGRDHTEIPIEPKIVAVEENLVLLRLVVSPEKEIYRDRDFFIYQANGADNEGPSLHRLPRPPGRCFFDYSKVGLLRYNDDNGGGAPHRVRKDEFIGAALCGMSEPGVPALFTDEDFMSGPGDFALFVYNSKLGAWSTNLVSLDQQHLLKQPGHYFLHFNSKVITIGGDAGTIGFVDLWRGILLCDVLKGDPKLTYVPLPKPILPDNLLTVGDARLSRDIAVIEGRIKYVELQSVFNPSLYSNHGYASDGWMARTYSRPVSAANSVASANFSEDDWGIECEIESSDHLTVDNNPHFDLLPRPQDSKGRPLPPFKSLVTCHPAVSLRDNDDDAVYFMNKVVPGDGKAWVSAVNMRTKELLGVAQFAAERTTAATFAYVHSRISKYLTGASGSKEHTVTSDGDTEVQRI